jgi:hypothetical protein
LALDERGVTVAVLSHLAEFDARGLHLGAGFSSLFAYCTAALGYSEQSAYNRIEAARAARRFPLILELLAAGRVTLTNVRLLAPHLTPQNHRTLLAEAAGKSRLQVEELMALHFPRPEAPTSVRKLPATAIPDAAPLLRNGARHTVAGSARVADTDGVVSAASRLLEPSIALSNVAASAPVAPLRGAAVVPLASDRYKITFTAKAATRQKLRMAQELLRHQVPHGDVADVVDRALDALLEQLTRRKFAAVSRPRSASTANAPSDVPAASGRHIPADVRRAVWLRDGGSCGFIAADGRRCGERGFVEFHHVRPFAVDGPPTATNIALRCRSHNGYEAELYFGPSRRWATAQPP